MIGDPVVDFDDTATIGRVTVRLRMLQIRLWSKVQKMKMIVTPQARAAVEELQAEYNTVAALALALEEGRVIITAPNEDTLAVRMAADVDMHFGVFAPPENEATDGEA